MTTHDVYLLGSPPPSVGRIVHFRLTAEQAEQVNRRRVISDHAGVLDAAGNRLWPNGAMRHVGNSVGEGSVVPLIVTAVWPKEFEGGWLSEHAPGTKYQSAFGINGQALLDGNDSLWVTSAPQHETLPGCWFWPPKV
jgi:hypothetical protein